MRILFVSSGNRKKGLNPIIKLQADSLVERGIHIEHFLIFGNGIAGYLKNIFKLRKYLKKNKFDLIHSHFGFSCIVAQIGKKNRPLVVTLMGTDVLGHKDLEGNMTIFNRFILEVNLFFGRRIYETVIVKNEIMKVLLKNRKKPAIVLSNGVDTQIFYEVEREKAIAFLDWDPNYFHFLFISNPERPEKNFKLAADAINDLIEKGYQVKLHAVFNEKSENLKYYYSAATALLLPSFHEGSPNVVKEALACNCPIVSTDVGDVSWSTSGVKGCYMAPYDTEGFAEKILDVIEFSKNSERIRGVDRISELNFEKQKVAEKLIEIYQTVIKQQ